MSGLDNEIDELCESWNSKGRTDDDIVRACFAEEHAPVSIDLFGGIGLGTGIGGIGLGTGIGGIGLDTGIGGTGCRNSDRAGRGGSCRRKLPLVVVTASTEVVQH